MEKKTRSYVSVRQPTLIITVRIKTLLLFVEFIQSRRHNLIQLYQVCDQLSEYNKCNLENNERENPNDLN